MSRTVLIGLGVLIVAFVVGLQLLQGPAPEAPPPAPEVAEAPPPAPEPEVDRRDDDSVVAEVKPTPPPVTNVERAARLRRRAKFPPTSRPIDDGLDPISQDTIPERARSNDDPEYLGPNLITVPTVTTFQAPADVVLYAEVVVREERQRGQRGDPPENRIPAAGIRGEIVNAAGEPVANVVFNDAGTDGDGFADDLFYTATYTPDPDTPGEFYGAFTVVVTAETTDGEELSATTGFSYAIPAGHLTGQYRDELVDGHLQIEAQVAIEEGGGEFLLEGTITSNDGQMLGHARNTLPLEGGTHWVPLTFWGLIIRERNLDGPYSLFSVTLATLTDEGPQPSDVVGGAHLTEAYSASDFTDTPFNDPALLERADQLDGGAGG